MWLLRVATVCISSNSTYGAKQKLPDLSVMEAGEFPISVLSCLLLQVYRIVSYTSVGVNAGD